MTLRYLLDTNVVSEPISKNADKRVLRMLNKHGHESAIASPVLHELRYGSRLLEPSRRRADVERYIEEVVLRVYTVLAYDQAAAEWHADERARLGKLGRPAPFLDGSIASIANVNSLVLVTANGKDFAGFNGLSVESWKS